MALTDSLINYWKIDEASGNLSDSVGSLTLTNTASATFGTGLIGNCHVGNSAGYFTNTTNNTSLGTTTPYTLNAWIWMSSLPSGQNDYMLAIGDTTNQLEYNVYYREDGTFHWRGERVRSGIVSTVVQVTTTLSTSTWHMSTVTWDGSTLELFLDGVSQATAAASGVGGSGGTAATSIGAVTAGAQPIRTNVKVDEVGVWTRELTGAEITELYNAGAGLQYPFTGTAIVRPNLLLMGV